MSAASARTLTVASDNSDAEDASAADKSVRVPYETFTNRNIQMQEDLLHRRDGVCGEGHVVDAAA